MKLHINNPVVIATTEDLVSHALKRMRKYKNYQIPMDDVAEFVGATSGDYQIDVQPKTTSI